MNIVFDLVILLRTIRHGLPMVLRSLGSDKERRRFQTLLIEMLDKNNIEYVKVDPPDYDERFLRCVELVRELLMMQSKHIE